MAVIVEVAVREVMGTPKVIPVAPLVVIFPPNVMLPEAPVVVNPPRAVPPPTAAGTVMTPVPAFKVSAWEPALVASIVEPKVIGPLLALVLIVLVPVKVTGDAVEMIKAFAEILAPILTAFAVVAAFVIVIVPSRVVPPTIPPKVTAPVVPAFKVKRLVPFNVAEEPEKMILAPVAAPEVVSSVTEVDKLAGPITVITPPEVVTPAPK